MACTISSSPTAKSPATCRRRIERVSSPRLVRRPSASEFRLGVGTTRFCLTESIASKAPAGHRQIWPCAVGVPVPRDRDRRASLHCRLGPAHDVEIANLIDKLDHHSPLTGYHERIVKRVDHDRLIVIHEFAQPCISVAPIFNHVHLSPIAQDCTMLHGRERFGHHDMRGGSLKTTGQRKSLPMIP
jgi:hypothetical protein